MHTHTHTYTHIHTHTHTYTHMHTLQKTDIKCLSHLFCDHLLCMDTYRLTKLSTVGLMDRQINSRFLNVAKSRWSVQAARPWVGVRNQKGIKRELIAS